MAASDLDVAETALGVVGAMLAAAASDADFESTPRDVTGAKLSAPATLLDAAGVMLDVTGPTLDVAGATLNVAGTMLGQLARGVLLRGAIMNQNQDNVATMFETTDATLGQYKELWTKVPAFANAVGRVEEGIMAIRTKQAGQISTGDAEAKQATRDAVEENTLVIASQLSALAAKNSDPMLAAKVRYDKSALDKASGSELLTAARAVQAAANENAAALAADYGVTAEELTALGVAIQKLDAIKDAPRQAVVNRRVATLSLPEAIAYVRAIFRNELDKMMEKFKKPAPDFYAAYFAARVIVDRTGTHAATKSTKASGPAPSPLPLPVHM